MKPQAPAKGGEAERWKESGAACRAAWACPGLCGAWARGEMVAYTLCPYLKNCPPS